MANSSGANELERNACSEFLIWLSNLFGEFRISKDFESLCFLFCLNWIENTWILGTNQHHFKVVNWLLFISLPEKLGKKKFCCFFGIFGISLAFMWHLWHIFWHFLDLFYSFKAVFSFLWHFFSVKFNYECFGMKRTLGKYSTVYTGRGLVFSLKRYPITCTKGSLKLVKLRRIQKSNILALLC